MRPKGATMNDLFADALASADASVQADFFNRFAECLKSICKGREGTQLWHIAEKLDKGAADLMKELVETRDYHKAEYEKDTLRRDDLRREIWDLEAKLKALRESEGA
jgi:hypothetical protein